MFWTFDHDGIRRVSWGSPRKLHESQYANLQSRFDIPVYDGRPIEPHEHAVFLMQGDATLGLGDSIWLINYLRDIYNIKGRRRCKMVVVSDDWVMNFYSNFLPSSFIMVREYLAERDFMQMEHKLPAMYYWHDTGDNADRSWVDNTSLVQRLYKWAGMEYNGLADWGEFTNEQILYPPDEFWYRHGLDKNDRYVYFQWHSSGHAKNLSPKVNVQLLKHITQSYGLKVYVVGRLNCLDAIESIPGVVNLSGKTEGEAEALFTLAFNSEFIVSPDSAGVHLAEAYKVPGVCIMGSLPPVYIASKYRIPTFMMGNGHCPYSPCGIVHHLPREKCPPDTGDYCKVLDSIDLGLFDRCLKESFENRARYRAAPHWPFYDALKQPISLNP